MRLRHLGLLSWKRRCNALETCSLIPVLSTRDADNQIEQYSRKVNSCSRRQAWKKARAYFSQDCFFFFYVSCCFCFLFCCSVWLLTTELSFTLGQSQTNLMGAKGVCPRLVENLREVPLDIY